MVKEERQVVWMDKRGISRKDFAVNHPAGKLGRELTLKVIDLMKPSSELNPLLKTAIIAVFETNLALTLDEKTLQL